MNLKLGDLEIYSFDAPRCYMFLFIFGNITLYGPYYITNNLFNKNLH